MKNVEGLNDPDGDRVEYTSGPEGVCVTVIWQETDWGSRQEITVGPFPADRLHWALDQVAEPETLAGFKETLDRLQAEILREATGGLMDGGVTSAAVEKEAASAPAGSYTRTESPDYADGGVTAAAIEKEAEGDLWAKATPDQGSSEWWMARWKEAADRADARDVAAHLWKETARKLARESRNAHDWAARVEESIGDVAARAEQAEKERDEMRDAWEGAIESVKEASALINSLRAEQPSTITADDFSVEAIDRAQDVVDDAPLNVRWVGGSGHIATHADPRQVVFDVITALTPPPSRPEGAEELEAVLSESPLGPEAVRGSLADFLAERGVRVTGAES